MVWEGAHTAHFRSECGESCGRCRCRSRRENESGSLPALELPDPRKIGENKVKDSGRSFLGFHKAPEPEVTLWI